MNIGVVLSGGEGARFGANTPKQYLKICGKEVLSFSIDALKKACNIHQIVVVCAKKYQNNIKDNYEVLVCDSGDSRNKSIRNALDFANKNFDCKKVIILDSARPMVDYKLVEHYISKLDEYDAVITGQKIVDSIGCVHEHILDRSKYYLIQAPEAFKFNILYNSFDENSEITATNQQMPQDSSLYINFDFKENLKITYPQDLTLVENILANKI